MIDFGFSGRTDRSGIVFPGMSEITAPINPEESDDLKSTSRYLISPLPPTHMGTQEEM